MARPSRRPCPLRPLSPARPLTEEDRALFRAAVADVAPLEPPDRVHYEPPRPRPRPLQRLRDERAVLFESLHGPLSPEDWIATGEAASYLRQGLSFQTLRDLRRGRWVIQDHIDLHGCNREEAHQVVLHFLADCLHQGHRCVRIVHGRGHGSPGKEAVLKQLVKVWLMRRIEVMAFCHPPPNDGGEGALWVLLRSQHR